MAIVNATWWTDEMHHTWWKHWYSWIGGPTRYVMSLEPPPYTKMSPDTCVDISPTQVRRCSHPRILAIRSNRPCATSPSPSPHHAHIRARRSSLGLRRIPLSFTGRPNALATDPLRIREYRHLNCHRHARHRCPQRPTRAQHGASGEDQEVAQPTRLNLAHGA